MVRRIRRALGTRSVGHSGTLDPMATGVLVLAIGEATKLVPWLSAEDKSYEATIALGVETDTLDAEGRATRHAPIGEALQEALRSASSSAASPLLRSALAAERTRTMQVPPAHSAIHDRGERAYLRARRGEATVLAARPVAVHDLALRRCSDQPPAIAVALDVAKGYYVRALARDLAAALGTVGHLTALRRTRSGCFSLAEAVSVPAEPSLDLAARIVPLRVAAGRVLPVATLSALGADHARHGRLLDAAEIEPAEPGLKAWLDGSGRLVAVGQTDAAGRGHVIRGFSS